MVSRTTKSFLLILAFGVGLASLSYSIYLDLHPCLTIEREEFILQDFQWTPWSACCFYYDAAPPIVVEPGNKLIGQVRLFFRSELPSDRSLPYFFLVSAGQFRLDNEEVAFRDHVYRSAPSNVTKNMNDQSITIEFSIDHIREKSQHFFVLVPMEGGSVLIQRMEVQGTIERVVPWPLPGLLAKGFSLFSFGVFGANTVVTYWKARRLSSHRPALALG